MTEPAVNELTELLKRVQLLDEKLAEELGKAIERRGRLLLTEWDGPANLKDAIGGRGDDRVRGLLKILADAPDRQLDKSIADHLRELADEPMIFPSHISLVLDKCAYAGLASSFAMQTLVILRSMITGEGM